MVNRQAGRHAEIMESLDSCAKIQYILSTQEILHFTSKDSKAIHLIKGRQMINVILKRWRNVSMHEELPLNILWRLTGSCDRKRQKLIHITWKYETSLNELNNAWRFTQEDMSSKPWFKMFSLKYSWIFHQENLTKISKKKKKS